jgi:hypothetical protein
MASSTLGKQRVNRRSHRNGAVCRFLAALGAGVILTFGVGAPIAAATTSARDGGDPGPRGGGDQRFREYLERLEQRILAEERERERERGEGTQTQSPPPPVVRPTPPPTIPVPVTVPPINLPHLPSPPNLVGAIPALPAGSAVSARTVPGTPTAGTAGTAALGGIINATPSGAGASGQAASPPAAAPSTRTRSPVARALRTARSYGVLLALAAAVVVFLMIQGRVDRRDPRILSAPAEERLTFQDFE